MCSPTLAYEFTDMTGHFYKEIPYQSRIKVNTSVFEILAVKVISTSLDRI